MPRETLQRNDAASGFTLLEVLVACGILTIGLASIITLYSSSLNGVSLAGKYEQAHFTAESVMARILFADSSVPFNQTGKTDQPPGALWAAKGVAGDWPCVNTFSVTVSFKHAGKVRTVALETAQVAHGKPIKQMRR